MADKIVTQDDPGRWGYGTGPAFEAFIKRLSSRTIPTTGLLLVNIDTIVRNTIDTNKKIEELTKMCCTYMANIASDFAAVVGEWRDRQHSVVFYHADCSRVVPTLFLRSHGGTSALLYKEVLGSVLKRVKDYPKQVQGNTTSYVVLANEMKQPSYKGLMEFCNKITSRDVTIHMISHNPIDWHIYRLGRNGLLYRSYTGTIVEMTAAKLGEVVFDMKGIPFNPLTHVLLGDKNVLKGLLIKNDKQQFITAAIREKFVFRSEDYIVAHAKINKSLIPYKLD